MNELNLTGGANRAILGLTESIDSLNEIVFKLGWAFFFVFIVFTVLLWIAIRTYQGKTSSWAVKFIPQRASELFESGEIDELVAYCDKHHNSHPNDIWISWYYAISYYNLGDLEAAKRFFEKVVQLNPSWESEVEPYIRKIDISVPNGKSH